MDFKYFQFGCRLGVIVISLICIPLAAGGATLSVSDTECDAGDTDVIHNVNLAVNSGEEIASLQFDLHYDENQLDFISAELNQTVEQDLGKIVEYNIISDGVVRFVIYGQNQIIFTDGLILEVTFDADAPEGESEISFENFIAASPDAQYVTLSTENGSVDILNGGTAISTSGASSGGGGGGCFIGSMSFWH